MIIYSLVARGTSALAEFAGTTGNFAGVSRKILEKIPGGEARMSYVYDRHIFHYIVDSGLVYLCMTDESFSRRLAFAFLEDIKGRFRATYGDRGRMALEYQMNEEFKWVLKKQMRETNAKMQEFYSTSPDVDKTAAVKGQLKEVKTVMVSNIEKVLQRGEKIELLVDRTESLNNQAMKFKKQSTQLRKAMWCKNFKFMCILALVASLVLFFVAAAACGGMDFKDCRSEEAPPPS